MQVFTLFDDVNLSLVPKGVPYLGVYVDGRFKTVDAAKAAFPHAYLFTITVFGQAGARCCDRENGDMSAVQAASWAKRELLAGRKPWIYASRDAMLEVIQALRAVGVSRQQVLLWSAHYGHGKHVCSPASCGASFTADACQFTDRSQGKSLDESEFLVNPNPQATVATGSKGRAKFFGTVDLATGKVLGVHGIPGLGVHFAGSPSWLDVNIQIKTGAGGGHWRAKP